MHEQQVCASARKTTACNQRSAYSHGHVKQNPEMVFYTGCLHTLCALQAHGLQRLRAPCKACMPVSLNTVVLTHAQNLCNCFTNVNKCIKSEIKGVVKVTGARTTQNSGPVACRSSHFGFVSSDTNRLDALNVHSKCSEIETSPL